MHLIIYDGNCKLCQRTVRVVNNFSKNFTFDPGNNTDEVIYVENYRVYRGFYAIRRIILKIPVFWFLLPILYFPFFDRIGVRVYRFISKNRNLWR